MSVRAQDTARVPDARSPSPSSPPQTLAARLLHLHPPNMPESPPPTPVPTLPEELLEEIFLRLPRDEPAWLVRASLASRLWLGLLSGPRFRGRYRELHGAPPMLGFLCRFTFSQDMDLECYPDPGFVSTGKFSPRFPQRKDWGYYGCNLWDCRHGRVLLRNVRCGRNKALSVWDPMTGRHTELDVPGTYSNNRAAVLCSVTGCDHIACHDGPFRVVFVGLHTSGGACVAYTHVSLPQTGEWSKPCSHLHLHLAEFAFFDPKPPVLTEDALYFMVLDADVEDDEDVMILKYDLGSNCLSLIHAPLLGSNYLSLKDSYIVLMAREDGSLGLACVKMSTLYLWSRKMGSNGIASWTACTVINLDKFLPIQNPKTRLTIIGSVEGNDIIFVTTDLGIYEISLKSLVWKKIWKRENFNALVPYMSFYDPIGRPDPCGAAH